MKHIQVGILSAAVLLAAPSIRAEDKFGGAGQIVISAERLFGVVAASETQKADGSPVETTGKSTTISFLSQPAASAFTNYSFARVGVDFFPIDGLSLGAAIGVFSVSTSSEAEGGGTTVEQDGPTLTGFVLAPRVGYAYLFHPMVGVWPRGGITYVNAGGSYDSPTGGSSESSANRLAVSLDVPLVIVPAPHAAITVGPTLDLGVSGGNENEQTSMGVTTTTKADAKATEFGLQVGLAIAF
jgi:hypothetical protein